MVRRIRKDEDEKVEEIKPEEEKVEEEEEKPTEETEKQDDDITEEEPAITDADVGAEENDNEVVDISSVPDMIERVYAQLDAIRDVLSEVAEAIRSGAEAQKALSEVMEKMDKKVNEIEKKIEEIAKVETPWEAHKEREKERYGGAKEPEATETAVERADEIASPERTAQMYMPEYLQKSGEIVKVQTPRPEVDNREIMKDEENVEVLKDALSGRLTAGELGERLKKIFGGRFYGGV